MYIYISPGPGFILPALTKKKQHFFLKATERWSCSHLLIYFVLIGFGGLLYSMDIILNSVSVA
jgi:hypothetical protein